ncbi:unnamed protein product [Closterium sp. NIES-54]
MQPPIDVAIRHTLLAPTRKRLPRQENGRSVVTAMPHVHVRCVVALEVPLTGNSGATTPSPKGFPVNVQGYARSLNLFALFLRFGPAMDARFLPTLTPTLPPPSATCCEAASVAAPPPPSPTPSSISSGSNPSISWSYSSSPPSPPPCVSGSHPASLSSPLPSSSSSSSPSPSSSSSSSPLPLSSCVYPEGGGRGPE